MGFPRRLLIEGEELIMDLRPHWIALTLPALVAVVAFAGVVWGILEFRDAELWLVLAFAIVLLAYPVPRLVWWLTSHFVVTSDRVIHREGWISKRSMEVPLEAINDVRFEQGIFDRIVGAGTVTIQSASESGRQVFDHIRKPEEVQKTIYHQGELNQGRMFRRDDEDAPPKPSATSELERLADLRARGVLTEAEFQAEKAKILGGG
jgi:uncharacterized membrane protein YdbT with pleckstrin-like domain